MTLPITATYRMPPIRVPERSKDARDRRVWSGHGSGGPSSRRENDRVSSRPRRSIMRAPNIGYATRGAATSTSAARPRTARMGREVTLVIRPRSRALPMSKLMRPSRSQRRYGRPQISGPATSDAGVSQSRCARRVASRVLAPPASSCSTPCCDRRLALKWLGEGSWLSGSMSAQGAMAPGARPQPGGGCHHRRGSRPRCRGRADVERP